MRRFPVGEHRTERDVICGISLSFVLTTPSVQALYTALYNSHQSEIIRFSLTRHCVLCHNLIMRRAPMSNSCGTNFYGTVVCSKASHRVAHGAICRGWPLDYFSKYAPDRRTIHKTIPGNILPILGVLIPPQYSQISRRIPGHCEL